MKSGWLFCSLAVGGLALGALALSPPRTEAADGPANSTAASKPPAETPTGPMLRTWRFSANTHQVALLELFTSQECASCPPVEQMVAQLPRDGYGIDRVVPLAFHVSYWPHLGWTDRFSREAFANRHQLYVDANELDGRVTPQIILNGQSHNERGQALYRLLDEIVARPAPFDFSVLVELQPGGRMLDIFGRVDRALSPSPVRDPAAVQFVLFEMGLSTRIDAGENKGKTLDNQYVVRKVLPEQWLKAPDDLLEIGHNNIPVERGWKIENMGVAGFVQLPDSGRILHAVGGLLDPKTAKLEKAN